MFVNLIPTGHGMVSNRPRRLGAAVVGGFLVASLVGCATPSGQSSSTTVRNEQPDHTIVEPTAPAFSLPAQSMPANGEVVWLETAENIDTIESNIANGGYGRLHIAVPPGLDTYYAKLRPISPGSRDTLGVTIAPGQSVTVDVPLNGNTETTYDLYYSAGATWYGKDGTFGPEGMYAKADDPFAFAEGTQWEVELILQPSGNLGTTGIDYSNF